MFRVAPGLVALIAAGLLVSPALGRAVTEVEGRWAGPAVSKVAVKRIGASRSKSTDAVQIAGNSWSCDNSNGWCYDGTWSPDGRNLSWRFGVHSWNELQDMLDDWAAREGFPDADTVVNSITTKAKARENRRGRVLKTVATVKFTGLFNGRVRTGRAKLRGRYTPD